MSYRTDYWCRYQGIRRIVVPPMRKVSKRQRALLQRSYTRRSSLLGYFVLLDNRQNRIRLWKWYPSQSVKIFMFLLLEFCRVCRICKMYRILFLVILILKITKNSILQILHTYAFARVNKTVHSGFEAKKKSHKKFKNRSSISPTKRSYVLPNIKIKFFISYCICRVLFLKC